MTPPTIPVARLSGVTLRYRHTVAVDAVDLDIPASYMVGFIGSDGVGKSSLLALLSGARKIQAGRVNVLGGDMANTLHRVGHHADLPLVESSELPAAHLSSVGEVQGQCHPSHKRSILATGQFCSGKLLDQGCDESVQGNPIGVFVIARGVR